MTERLRYWMHERSGKLRFVIEAYQHGKAMSAEDIGIMRDYLRQWIMSPWWFDSAELAGLRADVDKLTSRVAIQDWLDRAFREGINPL